MVERRSLGGAGAFKKDGGGGGGGGGIELVSIAVGL